MIIYGSKGIHLASENILEKCPNCQTSNNIYLHVYQRYAHIFWIPFFPTRKIVFSECIYCKQVLRKRQFPDSFIERYKNIKSQARTPFWTFIGLGFVILIVTLFIININQDNKRNNELILNPMKGDVYEIKNDYKSYTLAKVDRVAGDIVYIRLHQFETNGISGLTNLKTKGDSAYSEKTYPMLKRELKQMLDEDKIIDIDRK